MSRRVNVLSRHKYSINKQRSDHKFIRYCNVIQSVFLWWKFYNNNFSFDKYQRCCWCSSWISVAIFRWMMHDQHFISLFRCCRLAHDWGGCERVCVLFFFVCHRCRVDFKMSGCVGAWDSCLNLGFGRCCCCRHLPRRFVVFSAERQVISGNDIKSYAAATLQTMLFICVMLIRNKSHMQTDIQIFFCLHLPLSLFLFVSSCRPFRLSLMACTPFYYVHVIRSLSLSYSVGLLKMQSERNS